MLKVSFKGDFRKVQTFNDRVIVLTLTGKCVMPFWFSSIPPKIWEWITEHPSVDVSETYVKGNPVLIINVSGKSVCADGDTFDARTGGRIAECKAKIRLYRFMQILTLMLEDYYHAIMYGTRDMVVQGSEYGKGGIYEDRLKYTDLLNHERNYLVKLLQKTL